MLIKVKHKVDGKEVEFAWERVRLFEYIAASVLYDVVISIPLARVADIKTKPKSKWRPCALDTIVRRFFGWFKKVFYGLLGFCLNRKWKNLRVES